MACDPELQKELDRIDTEMGIEYEIAIAEEDMTIRELFDEAAKHGESYSQGYEDGFQQGRELLFKLQDTMAEAGKRKYDELRRRWGLEDL